MASKLSLFLVELKRRKVYSVAVVYAVVGVGVLGAAEVILEPLGLDALRPYLVILVLLGFPVALVLAWAYEVRPEEPKDSDDTAPTLDRSPVPDTGPAERAGAEVDSRGGRAAESPSLADSPMGPDPRSVAVLPFTDLGADPEYRYFSDGITEDVLAHLTKVKDLKVTSRTSVIRYRNTTKALREIAEELHVATVLEGSVRAVGGRVRVVAQLIDANTDTHLWADTYDRNMQDIFAVQSEVAEAVARALETELSREELADIHEPPTENVAAYALVLEGMAALHTFQPDAYARALDLFDGALRIDPDYARAHAGLALLLSFHPVVGLVPPPRYYERLKNAADRAMELDPSSSHAWLARGFFLWNCERDWVGAERAMVRASELEPENPVVLLMQAYWNYMLGWFDEALACFQRLEATDQYPPIAEGWRGLLDTYKAGYGELEFEVPMRRMDAVAESDPGLAISHIHRGLTLMWAGRLVDALESVERGLRIAPESPFAHGLRGAMLARLGRTDEARVEDDWFRNAEDPESADRFSWAIIWLNSEDIERGFDLLEAAVESHASFLLPFLRLAPTYQHLWDHPRFRSIVKAIWPGDQKRVLGPYGWQPGKAGS